MKVGPGLVDAIIFIQIFLFLKLEAENDKFKSGASHTSQIQPSVSVTT